MKKATKKTSTKGKKLTHKKSKLDSNEKKIIKVQKLIQTLYDDMAVLSKIAKKRLEILEQEKSKKAPKNTSAKKTKKTSGSISILSDANPTPPPCPPGGCQ